MSVADENIYDIAVQDGMSERWVNALIANKFSEILQDLVIGQVDQLEYYIIIWMITAFAFYQFQSAYIRHARNDGVIDRCELLTIKVIGIARLIIMPAIVGVVTQILSTQASNSELLLFEVIAVGVLLIITILTFSSQNRINEKYNAYSARCFIASYVANRHI